MHGVVFSLISERMMKYRSCHAEKVEMKDKCFRN